MSEYNSKIDLFMNLGGSSDGETTGATTQTESKQISASSSSSSAISSTSDQAGAAGANPHTQLSQDDVAIKNMIITNLVSYSYEIAHTVKRIVCVMGADN